MRVLLSIHLIVFFMFQSCEKDKISDDSLSLPKQSHTGNEIRKDGYWYILKNEGNQIWYNYCTFFYDNGTIFGGISIEDSNLSQKENEFQNGTFYESEKDCKYCWGRFIVNGSTIKFERWYPGEGPLRAYVRRGQIINDTTFHISEIYRMQNGEKTEVSPTDETYHFKALTPKPDSTNEFTN